MSACLEMRLLYIPPVWLWLELQDRHTNTRELLYGEGNHPVGRLNGDVLLLGNQVENSNWKITSHCALCVLNFQHPRNLLLLLLLPIQPHHLHQQQHGWLARWTGYYIGACLSRWWPQLIRIIKTFQISEELITRGSLITLCMSTLYLEHVTIRGSRGWGRGCWNSETILKRLRHRRNMSHLHPQYNAGVPLDIFFWKLDN